MEAKQQSLEKKIAKIEKEKVSEEQRSQECLVGVSNYGFCVGVESRLGSSSCLELDTSHLMCSGAFGLVHPFTGLVPVMHPNWKAVCVNELWATYICSHPEIRPVLPILSSCIQQQVVKRPSW